MAIDGNTVCMSRIRIVATMEKERHRPSEGGQRQVPLYGQEQDENQLNQQEPVPAGRFHGLDSMYENEVCKTKGGRGTARE